MRFHGSTGHPRDAQNAVPSPYSNCTTNLQCHHLPLPLPHPDPQPQPQPRSAKQFKSLTSSLIILFIYFFFLTNDSVNRLNCQSLRERGHVINFQLLREKGSVRLNPH